MNYKECIMKYIDDMYEIRKYIKSVSNNLKDDAKEYVHTIEKEWLFMSYYMASLFYASKKKDEQDRADALKSLESIGKKFDQKYNVQLSYTEDGYVSVPRDLDVYLTLMKIRKGVEKVNMVNRHNESALINIICTTEYCLKCAFTQLLKDDSRNISKEKKVPLTISEVYAFKDIQELFDSIAEYEVDKIMSKPFSEWLMLFKDHNINIKSLDRYVNIINEIFQRRHIIVHNQNIVDKKYTDVVNDDRSKVRTGDRVTVSSQYLDNAITIMLGFFTGLLIELFWKFNRHRPEYDELLMDISFTMLCNKEYNAILMLTSYFGGVNITDESIKIILKVNIWLAMKYSETDVWETQKSIITAIDYSHMGKEYEIAKYALLDDYEKVYNLACQILSEKENYIQKILTFPLFETFRRSDQFVDLLKEQKDGEKLLQYITDDGDNALSALGLLQWKKQGLSVRGSL